MGVRNAGIDWSSPGNCFWQHRVARKEAARIVLHGQSEFEASHVVLEGDQTFEVSHQHDGVRTSCRISQAAVALAIHKLCASHGS